ncbi:MAG: NINE protein [Porphyromonadaceae bacterium]|nr:NINE protein [Porphyromonadaceae bacterium]
MKKRSTAAILAFLLGGLGIHKFYLGKKIGILYLLFCWTLVPSIIAFIEFVLYLCMDDKTFNEKYNAGIPIPNYTNTADEIEKLYSLKEKGILTEEEFQKRKSELL